MFFMRILGAKMVREFNLINEKNQIFSMMDIENYCLLTEPSGLGLSYSTEYQQLGNTFQTNLRKIEQGNIEGMLHFRTYDNYRNFIDFVEKSESLRISYKIPYTGGMREFFKDVAIQSLTKSEIQPTTNLISESIVLDCLSLWYEPQSAIYQVEPETDEMRWDFMWDSKFMDYDTRDLQFVNNGHVEACIELEMNGDVENPIFELYIEGKLYQTVTIKNHILPYQTLKYGTKENNFYLKKVLEDGTEENLFNLETINFANDNVIRFPKNKSCTFKMSADDEILESQITIYVYYKAI